MDNHIWSFLFLITFDNGHWIISSKFYYFHNENRINVKETCTMAERPYDVWK